MGYMRPCLKKESIGTPHLLLMSGLSVLGCSGSQWEAPASASMEQKRKEWPTLLHGSSVVLGRELPVSDVNPLTHSMSGQSGLCLSKVSRGELVPAAGSGHQPAPKPTSQPLFRLPSPCQPGSDNLLVSCTLRRHLSLGPSPLPWLRSLLADRSILTASPTAILLLHEE